MNLSIHAAQASQTPGDPQTSDESRLLVREKLPLDLIDAASRICDPAFIRLRISGKLLKDYAIVEW